MKLMKLMRSTTTFKRQLSIHLPLTTECAIGLNVGGALQMQLLLFTVTVTVIDRYLVGYHIRPNVQSCFMHFSR